jgi:hypothetical protein
MSPLLPFIKFHLDLLKQFQHKKWLKIKFIYSLRPYIWYVTWYSLSNFFILHLMTLVYPRAKLYTSTPSIWYVTLYPSGNFFILHLMTPNHPRAEFYSSRPSIWYVTLYPSGNLLICTQWPWNTPGLISTLWDLPFDMSHDTLWVTFSFCTWWPWYTPGLKSTRLDLPFDMSHNTLRVTFWFCT